MNFDIPSSSLDLERVLHEQSISDTEPGPLLRDVAAMLDAIDEHDGIRVSAKQRQLYNKRLPDLNERLSHPTDAEYDRPTQKAYPYVHGLYLLVRAAGLTHVVEGSSHPQLVLRDEMVRVWQALNPTEQYMALLEAWIHRANEEELMGDGRQMFTPLFRMASFVSNLEEGEETYADKSDRDGLDRSPGYPHLALMHLFGWIELDEDGTAPQQPWTVHRVRLLPFGAAMLMALVELMNAAMERERPDDQESFIAALAPTEAISFTTEELHEALAPYFPDWERHLTVPDTSFTPAVHTLRVQIDASPHDDGNSFEARIAVPGGAALDAVAQTILTAAAFDPDHLYEFQFTDAYDRQQTVPAPKNVSGPPYTDEVRLGDLPLEEGASLTFRFDSRAEWRFGIEVESIAPADDGPSEVQLLDVTDDTPDQHSAS